MTDTNPETGSAGAAAVADAPAHRYGAAIANEVESRWQDFWEREHTFYTPNPVGELADGFEGFDGKPPFYILDMFPYPSGVGLHVGHPLGYIATDILARYKRMAGFNVLHSMGFDAFGLPAEQFAVQTGTHPRVTTENNIATMRAQLRRLGLGHDPRRSVATTDVPFYRWTQWIFLQLFNAWWDESQQKARPIKELIESFVAGERTPELDGEPVDWRSADDVMRRRVVNEYRLAYIAEAPVNWCPALGTVLSNEEVTADGRSDRGNHPVYKRPLRQWMMRITVFAERLLADLEKVDWPEPVKLMQRNWIGRSTGATVRFACAPETGVAETINVYTTRPDTLFGATYMVLAPEHPLVDALTTDAWPTEANAMKQGANQPGLDAPAGGFATPREAIDAYKHFAERKTDVDRQAEAKVKTGVFTGSYAINPVNNERIPVFIADYVLMGYGEGAIMAVPAHDERDWEFATQFEIPIVPVYTLTDGSTPEGCFAGEGIACNSKGDGVSLDGLPMVEAKKTIIEWLELRDFGVAAVNYKLRDWLFSRQRYWGEPFPIVFDEHDLPVGLPESALPVELPELADFTPEASDDPDVPPRPPLGRASDWTTVTLDLGEGPKTYTRELNTMPQWAGSCWYYLRYLDPTNDNALCDPEVDRYWMKGEPEKKQGGVDLYVGGVEHAVLHLLYARFWHKALHDLGHVSTIEPFARLVNQGYIQAFAYTDERGVHVEAEEVEERDGSYFHEGKPVNREYGKMGKSLKNAVTPDDICANFGADTLRLYEMSMGPLEQSKPWNTRDIIGSHRFLQRVWRNIIDEETGEVVAVDEPLDDESKRILHKTIAGVREDMDKLQFNTAISKMIECNNHLTSVASNKGGVPKEAARTLTLLLAPFAPHFCEELWSRLGQKESLAYESFPVHDPSLIVDDTIEIPVQILGKLRSKITVPAGADAKLMEEAALADERIKELIEGKTVRKVITVPGRLVNIVAN